MQAHTVILRNTCTSGKCTCIYILHCSVHQSDAELQCQICKKTLMYINKYTNGAFILQMYTMITFHLMQMRPSKGFWGTGEKSVYIRETGEQRSNFEGNKDSIGEQGT